MIRDGPTLIPKGARAPPEPKIFFYYQVKFSENQKKRAWAPLSFLLGPPPKISWTSPAHHPASPRAMNPPSPRAIIRPAHHPASLGAYDPGNLLKKKKQNKTLSTKVQTELRRKQKKPRKKKEKDREVKQRVERWDRD